MFGHLLCKDYTLLVKGGEKYSNFSALGVFVFSFFQKLKSQGQSVPPKQVAANIAEKLENTEPLLEKVSVHIWLVAESKTSLIPRLLCPWNEAKSITSWSYMCETSLQHNRCGTQTLETKASLFSHVQVYVNFPDTPLNCKLIPE